MRPTKIKTSQNDGDAPHATGTAEANDTPVRPPAPPDPAEAQAAPRLTSRQCEVLSLLCEGLPDKLIARRLDLSHHTVRDHVQMLYRRLSVSNRMQAIFAARQCGLIH